MPAAAGLPPCPTPTPHTPQQHTTQEDASASGRPSRYVAHRYGGGAECALTGRPRTAEVRYACPRGYGGSSGSGSGSGGSGGSGGSSAVSQRENVVVSVREFPSCHYVAVVATPLLCGHPAFVPPVRRQCVGGAG